MAVAERRRARAAANSASRSPPSSRVASTPTSALVMPPFVTRWSKPADRPISPFAEICGVYAARAARCRAAAAEVPNTAACTAGERPRARPTASSIVTVSAAAAGTAATSSTVTSMHVTAAPTADWPCIRPLHPVDAAVAPGDLLPVKMVEEPRHVLLAPRVILGPGMLRNVADHERVGADPDAAEIVVHDDVVPAVVVRIVDERGPAV